MSLLRVAAIASLYFYSSRAFAVAQVSGPICTSATWQWTFNSLGQSPCTVTAYMMATCNGGKYRFPSLSPGYLYYGPEGADDSNLCYCNSVAYSLFSACGACQGEGWISWSEWVTNCTKTLPPPSFPNLVPSGTRIPQWTLLDVTNKNIWNPNKSYAVGARSWLDSQPLRRVCSPTSSSGAVPTVLSILSQRSEGSGDGGAVAAGGVVAGIAVVLFCILTPLFFHLRRRSRVQAAASAAVDASQMQQPKSDEVALSPITPVKIYDPDDPTTFPFQVTMPAPVETGRTLANTQTHHLGPAWPGDITASHCLTSPFKDIIGRDE
ncbi:hypothetical protein BJV77DRAFT_539661 [Russula vinacea]|nr:hypothetical protein BJV77DRAFT_539661 [Russula vinacea]